MADNFSLRFCWSNTGIIFSELDCEEVGHVIALFRTNTNYKMIRIFSDSIVENIAVLPLVLG